MLSIGWRESKVAICFIRYDFSAITSSAKDTPIFNPISVEALEHINAEV
jgi:hypothetical protein